MSRSRKRARADDTEPSARPKSPRRYATVYDAVAGRIGYESFVDLDKYGKTRDTKTSSSQAVYPEEVLFRRKGAPLRYEETDEYFAHEKLGMDDLTKSLPSSDLLKAIHAYSSLFYSRAAPLSGQWDWRSMDETALLALGILLEETVGQRLGKTGDLALIEGEDADEGLSGPITYDGTRVRRRVTARVPRGKGLRTTMA